MKKILIVGGTSGLGLALATQYAHAGHNVFVTGRKNPQKNEPRYIPFSIDYHTDELQKNVDDLIEKIGPINTLIYAAGYYQEGCIDELSAAEVLTMLNVGITAPLLLIRRLKNNPGKPLKVIFITSTSQFTPRGKEPVYTSVKAALGMLGNSLGLDNQFGKILVVAPSGMNTNFWQEKNPAFLDPNWVAEEIIKLSSGPFKYRFAKILRNPARIEIVETRQNS